MFTFCANPIKPGSFIFGLAISLFFFSCSPDTEDKSQTISRENLERHIQTLSSDEFLGRMPFTAGEEKTLAYLTDQFKKLGLEPGNGDGFLQDVPLMAVNATAPDRLVVNRGSVKMEFEGLKEYVIWTQRTDDRVAFEDAEIVFAGFGVVAPEYGWDDYKDIDVRGKIVMVLVNDPGFGSDDESFFKGNTMTYYGRWTYKFEEAARQGALGCLVVHNTIPAGYGFNVIQNSWNTSKLYLDNRNDDSYRMAFEGWVSLSMANSMFSQAGFNPRDMLAKARSKGFRAIPLALKTSGSLDVRVKYDISQNAVAKISGTTSPDEYIIYTAHWDHLGVGKPDEQGDSIYNGALDNASGTAALLEIARAFKEAPEKPERTVVFLFVTAEEQGLLGSAYYAENPIYPIARTVANINMDGINPYGRMRDMEMVGMGQSELEDWAAQELEKEGRYVSPESNPVAGFYFRSDHFNFAKKGIPALYMGTGIDHVEKGEAYGKELADGYVMQYYHKPSDEYDPSRWNLDGAVEDVTILYRIGHRLALSQEWPGWKEGSEFKALRE